MEQNVEFLDGWVASDFEPLESYPTASKIVKQHCSQENARSDFRTVPQERAVAHCGVPTAVPFVRRALDVARLAANPCREDGRLCASSPRLLCQRAHARLLPPPTANHR